MSRFRAWTTFPPTCSPFHPCRNGPAVRPVRPRDRTVTFRGGVSRVSSPPRRGAHLPDATDAGPSARSGESVRNGWRRSVQHPGRPWRLYHQASNVCATDGSVDECSRHRSTCPTPAQSKAALARTVKEQRRGHARAVLAALARSLQGRPTPQIRQIVKTSLQPLGVRLSTVELQTIAKGISAGHPVQLPG